MHKLTSFSALAAAALIGIIPGSAWPGETTASGPGEPAIQAPVPAGGVVPGWYPSPYPGGFAHAWQSPPHWQMGQPGYGYSPPYYGPGGQTPAFAAAPVTAPAARENPLSAELKQAQDQLNAKSGELETAHGMLEQLRARVQDNFAAEKKLSEKLARTTLEQRALQARVAELGATLDTANATLEQQRQLINNHQALGREVKAERDQLRTMLASLQSELQAAKQVLAQARARTGSAVEALAAVRIQLAHQRDAVQKIEADLAQQAPRPQE